MRKITKEILYAELLATSQSLSELQSLIKDVLILSEEVNENIRRFSPFICIRDKTAHLTCA